MAPHARTLSPDVEDTSLGVGEGVRTRVCLPLQVQNWQLRGYSEVLRDRFETEREDRLGDHVRLIEKFL